MITLRFLGGAGTTTGSKFLLLYQGRGTLIDCGLFQGPKRVRELNWNRLPIDPKSISEVLLTHAHIDHSGYLPCLVRDGFSGPIHATSATTDLARIMLPDSAHIQEEDAAYANKQGFSNHDPALPLYMVADAQAALQFFRSHAYDTPVGLTPDLSFLMRDAGHILGSATLELCLRNGDHASRIVFSGDLGRYNAPILKDPAAVDKADYLLLESTYGDRLHEAESPSEILAQVINDTVKQEGSIIIPAFAVGRSQTLLYLLRELREQNKIPRLPVYLDSPMAVDATQIFRRHPEDYDPDMLKLEREGKSPFSFPGLALIQSVEESKALNWKRDPCVIIASSGMATSGRILHHLKWRLPDPRNTILLVGYQALDTRGDQLLKGQREIKIHGEMVPVRARVHNLGGLSAHADYRELLRWLRNFKQAPKTTFIVHGEPESSAALAAHVEKELGWPIHLPALGEQVTLKA